MHVHLEATWRLLFVSFASISSISTDWTNSCAFLIVIGTRLIHFICWIHLRFYLLYNALSQTIILSKTICFWNSTKIWQNTRVSASNFVVKITDGCTELWGMSWLSSANTNDGHFVPKRRLRQPPLGGNWRGIAKKKFDATGEDWWGTKMEI